ncbi:hypothetical protein AAG906_004039 [Vitis piasezkii]
MSEVSRGGRRKGLLGGWNTLAEKLRGLGVEPYGGAKPPITPEAQQREKGAVSGSFFEAAKSKPERTGRRRVQENFLCLEKWNPEVGCFWKESHANEAWVRVVGLPLHLWSRKMFKKFGDGCKGFISEDEDTTCMTELQWARILVKLDGRRCFSILLWWEFSPWFVQVVLSLRIHVNGTTVAREEDEGSSRATCSGRSKESLVQVEAQCRVQDVSPPGDLLKDGAAFAAACSARLQAVGTVKASEEGCLGGNVLTEGSNYYHISKPLLGVTLFVGFIVVLLGEY